MYCLLFVADMLFSNRCRCVALLSHGLPVRKIVEAGPERKNLSPSISATLLHISFLAIFNC